MPFALPEDREFGTLPVQNTLQYILWFHEKFVWDDLGERRVRSKGAFSGHLKLQFPTMLPRPSLRPQLVFGFIADVVDLSRLLPELRKLCSR